MFRICKKIYSCERQNFQNNISNAYSFFIIFENICPRKDSLSMVHVAQYAITTLWTCLFCSWNSKELNTPITIALATTLTWRHTYVAALSFLIIFNSNPVCDVEGTYMGQLWIEDFFCALGLACLLVMKFKRYMHCIYFDCIQYSFWLRFILKCHFAVDLQPNTAHRL